MKQTAELELTSSDLLAMEDRLCAALSPFLSFKEHALYFPVRDASGEPRLLPRERRLLLPLIWQGETLGVLRLGKVATREARRVLPHLAAVTGLCLENLARAKAQVTDSLTGFLSEDALLAHLEREGRFAGMEEAGADAAHRLCLGIALLRMHNGRELATRCGHFFADDLLRRLASACRDGLPSDVLAARVEKYAFALLFPARGRETCRKLAEAALRRMESVRGEDPATRQVVKPELAGGHALYPQDLGGADFGRPLGEQGCRLLDRAKLACDVAGPGRVMAFAHMLRDGGVVEDILPLGRVRVNLGRRMGLAVGQRFALLRRDGDKAYKGEVAILQADAMDGIGEVQYLEDAAVLPEKGDCLALLCSGNAGTRDAAGDGDAGGGGHAGDHLNPENFRLRFERERKGLSAFTLAIVRLGPGASGAGQPEERLFHRACREWRKAFSASPQAFVGRWGAGALICFHPGVLPENLRSAYEKLCAGLSGGAVSAAAGLAAYPLLSYSRAETQDLALKALEYALLLPKPHVGVCDSLALNISADRRYSQGDVFGAMEEYKRALLLDDGNTMAWNSLGVCMAALGRMDEARRHFREALRRNPDKAREAQICYNLGTVCQNVADRRGAYAYYRRCIRAAPDYLFAWIRLGQLCEQGRRRTEAQRMYERAAAIEDAGGEVTSLARRHLAQIAVARRRGDEARGLLHEALRRNPADAAAMLLLAKIYLDCGENPSLAEFLARRSVGLHDRPEAWQVLARALRTLDRPEDARLAEARALLA